ncbi:L-2-hydroxyglutarate oxidase [Glutamicibacter sp. MCAF14]|uniref:L-2-hydroxyglutarate oxidase n=1 Tax=Glutamicibacter sp. MCAF14 TaxID=3233043 RepID=UPI003F909899
MSTYSFGVVGAGIIGAAVARELMQRHPGAQITIIEKSEEVAAHQTGHNSGVVHAGLYYQPGSLKARLCRRGVDLLRDYAIAKNVPYEECGKLVVALTEEEEGRVRAIYSKAVANGVPDVELIGPEEIRKIEPNAVGRLALHSPHTAIIDYAGVTRAMIEEVTDGGAKLLLNSEVIGISNAGNECIVTVDSDGQSKKHKFDYLVVCAGLQSDRVARLAGGAAYPKIVPFFGQYSKLAPEQRNILNGLVYPVPDPEYPFLGVHLTKRVDGEMLVGPNAFLSFGRENYKGWRIGVKDTLDVVFSRAFWKFASGNMKAAVQEFGAVVSRKKFLAGAAAYAPDLNDAASTPITRGIRAQAMDENGQLVDDFVIERLGRVTALRNAPSPGATSSLAIAEHLVEHLGETLEISDNKLPSSDSN